MSPGVAREADAAAVIRTSLAPEVTDLLRTTDPETFADRLLRLAPESADEVERVELDRVVQDAFPRRSSWWELGARLGVVGIIGCLVLAFVLVAASFAAAQFHRLVSVTWLAWPLTDRTFSWVLLLLGGALVLGWLVILCRAIDHRSRARVALQVAHRHEMDHWPGLLVHSPFREAARLWSYPGTVAILAAVGVPLGLALVHRLGAGMIVLAVLWLALGGWFHYEAAGLRRADALARSTLFAELD